MSGEVNGFSNWDTWHTKLMMDNDQDLYNKSREIVDHGVEKGWSDEEIAKRLQEWAVRNIISPHNRDAIKDAQEWNDIPKEERIDPHYEDLKNKSPQAADLVDSLGFGPNVEDTEPTLIREDLVNWDELVQDIKNEFKENDEYERQEQRKAELTPYDIVHWNDEHTKMMDAWLSHHGVDPHARSYGPDGERERGVWGHQQWVPIDLIKQNVTEYGWPHGFGDATAKQIEDEGGWNYSTRDLGEQAATALQRGQAVPWQQETMQKALQAKGYTPEEAQQIMRQRYKLVPNPNYPDQNMLVDMEKPPPQPDPSLDQPGNLTLPEHWGSFTEEPHAELYPCLFEGRKTLRWRTVYRLKNYILDKIASEFPDADKWTYFTLYGSGISYNWDEEGDLDVQMWLDIDKYNRYNDPTTSDELVAAVRRAILPVNFPTCKKLGLTYKDCAGKMIVQYFAKPGTGSEEENLASQPYACYDLEQNKWLKKPEPFTPKFYGEEFLLVEPEAKELAVQINAALDALARDLADATFWDDLYEEYGEKKYLKARDEARALAEKDSEGVHELYVQVYKGRQEAYSPEGKGINDSRDALEKLLEQWGIFQRLKEQVHEPLPWKESHWGSVHTADEWDEYFDQSNDPYAEDYYEKRRPFMVEFANSVEDPAPKVWIGEPNTFHGDRPRDFDTPGAQHRYYGEIWENTNPPVFRNADGRNPVFDPVAIPHAERAYYQQQDLKKRASDGADYWTQSQDDWWGTQNDSLFNVNTPGEAPGMPHNMDTGADPSLFKNPCWCDVGPTDPHEWTGACENGKRPTMEHEAADHWRDEPRDETGKWTRHPDSLKPVKGKHHRLKVHDHKNHEHHIVRCWECGLPMDVYKGEVNRCHHCGARRPFEDDLLDSLKDSRTAAFNHDRFLRENGFEQFGTHEHAKAYRWTDPQGIEHRLGVSRNPNNQRYVPQDVADCQAGKCRCADALWQPAQAETVVEPDAPIHSNSLVGWGGETWTVGEIANDIAEIFNTQTGESEIVPVRDLALAKTADMVPSGQVHVMPEEGRDEWGEGQWDTDTFLDHRMLNKSLREQQQAEQYLDYMKRHKRAEDATWPTIGIKEADAMLAPVMPDLNFVLDHEPGENTDSGWQAYAQWIADDPHWTDHINRMNRGFQDMTWDHSEFPQGTYSPAGLTWKQAQKYLLDRCGGDGPCPQIAAATPNEPFRVATDSIEWVIEKTDASHFAKHIRQVFARVYHDRPREPRQHWPRLGGFFVTADDIEELADKAYKRLADRPDIMKMREEYEESRKAAPNGDAPYDLDPAVRSVGAFMNNIRPDVRGVPAETYKMWEWLIGQFKRGNANWWENNAHIRDILTQATKWMQYCQEHHVSMPDWKRKDFTFDDMQAWVYEMNGKDVNKDVGWEGEKVIHTFDDGWYMSEVPESDCGLEGELMGHCVGGYGYQISSGASYIVSLRDPKGHPHVTLEMEGTPPRAQGAGYHNSPTEWLVQQIQGKQDSEPIPEYQEYIKEWFNSLKEQGYDIKWSRNSVQHGGEYGYEEPEYLYDEQTVVNVQQLPDVLDALEKIREEGMGAFHEDYYHDDYGRSEGWDDKYDIGGWIEVPKVTPASVIDLPGHDKGLDHLLTLWKVFIQEILQGKIDEPEEIAEYVQGFYFIVETDSEHQRWYGHPLTHDRWKAMSAWFNAAKEAVQTFQQAHRYEVPVAPQLFGWGEVDPKPRPEAMSMANYAMDYMRALFGGWHELQPGRMNAPYYNNPDVQQVVYPKWDKPIDLYQDQVLQWGEKGAPFGARPDTYVQMTQPRNWGRGEIAPAVTPPKYVPHRYNDPYVVNRNPPQVQPRPVVTRTAADNVPGMPVSDSGHWVWLDGKVGFGGAHHEIAEKLADELGYGKDDKAYVANWLARGHCPQDRAVAVGTFKNNRPYIWNSTRDRNHIWDAVMQAREGLQTAS